MSSHTPADDSVRPGQYWVECELGAPWGDAGYQEGTVVIERIALPHDQSVPRRQAGEQVLYTYLDEHGDRMVDDYPEESGCAEPIMTFLSRFRKLEDAPRQ